MSYSEELRRFFLAGIGAMATTAEKSRKSWTLSSGRASLPWNKAGSSTRN